MDELFGRFLAAAHEGAVSPAGEAMREFDEELRRHTALEEESVFGPTPPSLAPAAEETQAERRVRELLLEHVQIRELSGMMRHLLEEKGDLAGASSLAGNLARRWDAHTSREEREVFPTIQESG